jgi:hypothetical protein
LSKAGRLSPTISAALLSTLLGTSPCVGEAQYVNHTTSVKYQF